MLRVISQDGTVDVPYDSYVIWCYKDPYLNTVRIACDCGDKEWYKLADYTTEEKAIKAMGMLRAAYLVKAKFFNSYGHGYEVGLNKVFKFPQDDEIEV